MSKQKNNEVLKYNEPAFARAGDYWIPLIKLQPVEEKRLNKYGRMLRVFLQERRGNSGLILRTLTNRHRTNCS